MFKLFPIFYSPDEEEYGGGQENPPDELFEDLPPEDYEEQEQQQEEIQEQIEQEDEQEEEGSVNYEDVVQQAVEQEVPDAPTVDSSGQTGERVRGTGKKFLDTKTYKQVGAKKNQWQRNKNIGGPPPPSTLPKHIHLHSGPFMDSNTGLDAAKIRISVNKYVTAEDPNTGSITIDTAYDSVIAIMDITAPNQGAPYYTEPDSQTITFFNQPPVDVGVELDNFGVDYGYLEIAHGTEAYISTNNATEQLFLEYGNDANTGAYPPITAFRRKIKVVWASGWTKEFEVLLPGRDYLAMTLTGTFNHANFNYSTRADGCQGDGTSGHDHTSLSENYITYTGNQHNDYAYLGFFKSIANNNTNVFPNTFLHNSQWNNFRFYDWSFDSNGGNFNIGISGNVKDGFAPTQHYKGIIGNGHIDAIQQINSTITGNAYDFAYNELFRAPYITPNPAFDPYGTAGFGTFRFAEIQIYAVNTPSCTGTPTTISFDACLDQASSDYYGYTGVDCSSNNLLAFGTPATNYVANPTLAQWQPGSCCTDCNNLAISLVSANSNLTTSTQGGTDGVIEVTVLNNSGSATGNGNATSNGGNGRYAWTIQALNSQTIGGLGTGSLVTLGYGYAVHPQGTNQPVSTFTFGHNVNLAQDAVSTPSSSAFAGVTALSTTIGGNTQILVPASTVNGTFSEGLKAGCYRIYVRDESVNPAGTTTPCFASLDVCITDGVGIAGCTDNNAGTNFGAALNYQSLAVVDDGSCVYCHATNGSLIDNGGNLVPTNGEIASSGVNSFITTPTIRTNSNDGQVNIQNCAPTSQFQLYVNDIVDSNGLANVDYTLQLFTASNKVDWDNAQTSITPNDLTNFSTVGSLVNNGNQGWAYVFNTTSLGTNLNYGYYAVKVAVSDPDATVEIEECHQVFYFVIPINVCVDGSGTFATAITNTNTPPGTLVIPQAEDILWYPNPAMCNIINNFCCDVPTLTNPSQPCQVNTLVADFVCNPVPQSITFVLEYNNSGTWTTVNSNTHNPTGANYSYTYTQGATVSANSFVDDGNYRVVLTSNYNNSASCTQTSAAIQVTSGIFGCTDSTALNYDPNATCDDGSCVSCVYGCTDPAAFNYHPAATCDDGSCVPVVYGCTDSTAINYNAQANTDDGSCLFGTLGCTDSSAYNYNKNCAGNTVVATVDDGCCFFPCDPTNQGPAATFTTTDATGDCGLGNDDGTITVDIVLSGVNVMAGQTKTISYFDNSGNLIFADPTTYTSTGTSSYNTLLPGVYSFTITDNFGCTDTQNFSIGSTIANCGCTDPNASNYDPTANTDDGSCLYGGCTDPNATNFNPNAATDDGSCVYPAVISPCVPSNTNSLIRLLEACIAKNGFQYYNKLVTGQADDCSIMNAWKVILIEYLVSKRGTKCIYNCADSATAAASSLTTCTADWIIGGPKTGANDQGHPGSSIVTGQGTTITDINLFFVSTNKLYLGDMIKMPSGHIYRVVVPFTSANPVTAAGAMTKDFEQCVNGLRINSFPDSVNYLDKFNTFVTKFCVDCDIEDENVIKPNQQNQQQVLQRTNTLPLDGISGITI